MRYTFHKHERLCNLKHIELLMRRSNPSGISFPLMFSWCHKPLGRVSDSSAKQPQSPVEVLISVSRKKHPTAVARNRIKRCMREAYRLNKHLLYDKINQPVLLHINYLSKDILSYHDIEEAMVKGIQKINL